MTIAVDFGTMRRAMVASQLRTNAVGDARVVAAMADVRRELFVPTAQRHLAYRDTAVLLGGARALNAPVTTGRLLNEAVVAPTDSVLLIGAATGYTAAVLSLLAASVVAVESDPALLAVATPALAGVGNVTLIAGPLIDGAPGQGLFDVLLIDGAVEAVPEALVAQLKPGGRIATGLVDRGVTRLAAGARSDGGFGLQDFADVECVVLPGFAKPRAFTF